MQTDQRLCWSHISHCWKSHALANFINIIFFIDSGHNHSNPDNKSNIPAKNESHVNDRAHTEVSNSNNNNTNCCKTKYTSNYKPSYTTNYKSNYTAYFNSVILAGNWKFIITSWSNECEAYCYYATQAM